MMKIAVRISAMCVVAVLLTGTRVHAQVSLAPAAGYTQTFDGLPGTGAAGTLVPWSDNATISGWYAYKNRAITGSPIGPPANYFIDDGSSSSGGDGLRSYGSLTAGQTNGASDRALGELSSTDSALVFSFGVRLANATGAPVTSLMIAYRGEQWRRNTGTKGLVFEYQTGGSSISAGAWTAVPALDLQPLQTGAAGPLDGNAPGNFAVRSARIGVALAPGEEIWLRWTKQGITSCGLAVDDLAVVPAPSMQPANIQFGPVTSTSMALSFSTPSLPSAGYVVLRKSGSASVAVPVNGVSYAAGDVLGDAVVVASGADTTVSQRGLVPGTTYYFAIFAFNGSGSTTNYLAASPLAGSRATPAALASVTSDAVAVAGSEAPALSSLTNDAPPLTSSTGTQVWKFTIRDGGPGPDADLKPTIVTEIGLRQGTKNTAVDWQGTIRAADLFEGATHIASGTISATKILFPASRITVPDDGSTTLTIRVSLRQSGLTDHQALHFALAPADIITESDATSSQTSGFASIVSDEKKNVIDVAATKLHFLQQPTDAAAGMIVSPPVVVEAVDANNNRDADFSAAVSLTASGAVLAGAPAVSTASGGAAAFATLTFTTAGSAVSLTAAANGWTAVSDPFRITAYRTFFVDATDGNDAASGLAEASAWKTLGKVNATMFQPGDSILFKAGRTWTGQFKPKGSGDAQHPIVAGMYGGAARPILNGGGITGEAVVYLNNQEYWEIADLEITNDAAAAGDRRGVLVAAANYGVVDHIYLKHLYIHHIKGIVGNDNAAKRTAGIGFEVAADAVTPTRFNDIWIDSCTIANVDNTGLYTDNIDTRSDYPNSAGWQSRKYTNLRITNNVIHHIAKNAMIIRLSEGGLIEHNVCYETATGTTGNTMFTTSCDGTVFQYNEGYLNRAELHADSPGGDFGDGSMYDADLQSINCVFQYSYSHDNSHGLFWTCTTQQDTGNVCRYNVSRNDKGIIFCINYPVTSVAVYNNTVYCGSSTLSPTFIAERNVNSGTRTYSFSNNIIYNLSAAAKPYLFRTTGYTRTIDHNLFYGFHPAGEPADANKLTGDPLFLDAEPAILSGWTAASGFALKQGSPAINSGVPAPAHPSKDYLGNPVPNGGGTVDRGAFEYRTSSAAPRSGTAFPTRFLLEQNFPNPFNPVTDIRYSLPAADRVMLTIHNVLGQQVAALVDGYQDAGDHRVTFSGDRLSSGVYIYTLTAGGFSESKRLVLEK